MHKYVRCLVCFPFGLIKITLTKMFHINNFSASIVCLISPFTEITMDKNSKLKIGKKFRMRDGAKIRVRKNASCEIGSNVSLNTNNIITCHKKIVIGDDVQFSPNVQIYDHDHDFRVPGGVSKMEYQTGEIIIGDNVWIGANTIILRNTIIGDNSVIGAGSVVKGIIPSNSVMIQRRTSEIRMI